MNIICRHTSNKVFRRKRILKQSHSPCSFPVKLCVPSWYWSRCQTRFWKIQFVNTSYIVNSPSKCENRGGVNHLWFCDFYFFPYQIIFCSLITTVRIIILKIVIYQPCTCYIVCIWMPTKKSSHKIDELHLLYYQPCFEESLRFMPYESYDVLWPVTGSAVKITPARADGTNFWMTTHISVIIGWPFCLLWFFNVICFLLRSILGLINESTCTRLI